MLLGTITFSAFAGFAIGHFLKLALSIMAYLIGFALLVVFGLHYYGAIETVNYEVIASVFEGVFNWLLGETSSVIEFAKKSVPGAAGFASGFGYAIFRRR